MEVALLHILLTAYYQCGQCNFLCTFVFTWILCSLKTY